MPQIVNLQQGSAEWLAHRLRYRNASETAAVMGASPWMTPFQLWELRTGRREQPVTSAMRHGLEHEAAARAAYETLTGSVMQPLVLVEGDYSASLDGLTLKRSRLLEIKCPYRGQSSEIWQVATRGEVPVHYRWQLQHQLFVSGAEVADLFVYDADGGQTKLIQVEPDPSAWDELHAAWDDFWKCLEMDTPPPLTDRDTNQRGDDAWQIAADAYRRCKADAERTTTALNDAKAALLALSSHPVESGAGVTVTRFWKRGAVDYGQIPELGGVDLESYRKAGRMEVRISEK